MRIQLPVLAIALASATVHAQAVVTRTLGKPVAVSADGFTEVSSALELRDGRVLVTELRETRLALVDFVAKTVKDLTRTGPGPTELTGSFAIVPWLADTILVYGRSDLLKVSQSTQLFTKTGFRPLGAGGGGFGAPRFADREGRLYYEQTAPLKREADGTFMATLEASWMRWDARTNSAELVTTLQYRDPNQPMYKYWRPFQKHDAAATLPDGSTIVVRAQDYHTEVWRDGKLMTKNAPIGIEPLMVTAADRNAFRDERASQPAGGMGRAGAPINIAKLSEAEREARRKTLDLPDHAFPATMSPIAEFLPAQVDFADRVWIARSYHAGATDRVYDVFDAKGALVMRVTVPNRGRIVGFGRNTAFIVTPDDDDIQWLGKVPLPN